MALIRKQADQQRRAGSSIGERREIQKDFKAQATPQRAQQAKPLDKFAGVNNSKSKKGLAGFAANATYQQARRFHANGTPYKRALHDSVEQGTTPVSTGSAKPPSDPAILKFLDRVISMPTKASAARRSAPTAAKKANVVQRSQRRTVSNPQSQQAQVKKA